MVVNKYGEMLYAGLVRTSTAHLEVVASRIEGAQGESLLTILKAEWDNHNKSFSIIREILMYMDRVYVKQQSQKPIHELGLDLWRDVVVRRPGIRDRMQTTLLDMISRERSGEIISRDLIRSITGMLADLGPLVYAEIFESVFLERTAQFYGAEAAQYIASCDCPAYLRHAEDRLAQEAERVAMYLHPSTGPRVADVAQKELIAGQVSALINMEESGAVQLLERDDYEPLHSMYSLFLRVGGDTELRSP